MKVGIDLSSTNTGLVILSDDNKLIWHGNFQLGDSNRFTIACNVEEMIDTIRFKLLPQQKNIIIGVELADFKNANITNRFNLLTGMIIMELHHGIIERIDLKLFNSNEGQRFLTANYYGRITSQTFTIKNKKVVRYKINNIAGMCQRHKINTNGLDKRQLLKELSRMFSSDLCLEYQDTGTEDECDAYCIAYFLEGLRDRTQMHQEVKAKKVQAKKSKVQELRDKIKAYNKAKKLYEIVNHYKDLANVKKLTKTQQRALEKAESELKEYEK